MSTMNSIIRMCIKYDFYTNFIINMLLQKKELETMSGIADSSGIILESFTACGEFVGFTINMSTTQEVYCVKFVFIKPEYVEEKVCLVIGLTTKRKFTSLYQLIQRKNL